MNRDTIIGLGLIFVILIGYSIWMTPSEEEKEAARFRQDSIARVHRTQDSIALLRLVEQQHQDSINKLVQREAEAIQTSDTNIPGNVDRDKLGVFANSSVG